MAKTSPKTTWKALGKKLKTDEYNRVSTISNPVNEDELIDIVEQDKSFTMDGYEDAPIAGKPIDAKLAIHLIKKFSDSLPKIPKNILDGTFRERFTGYSDKEYSHFEKWIVSLLLFSRAISIDKSILLKTLSQPGCEGVRFYLCLKDNIDFDEENFNSKNPKEIMSLVLVGIDEKGKDLLYEFNKDEKKYIQEGVYRVETASLTSEYNYPPPPNSLTRLNSENTYVLGEFAWNDILDKSLY